MNIKLLISSIIVIFSLGIGCLDTNTNNDDTHEIDYSKITLEYSLCLNSNNMTINDTIIAYINLTNDSEYNISIMDIFSNQVEILDINGNDVKWVGPEVEYPLQTIEHERSINIGERITWTHKINTDHWILSSNTTYRVKSTFRSYDDTGEDIDCWEGTLNSNECIFHVE